VDIKFWQLRKNTDLADLLARHDEPLPTAYRRNRREGHSRRRSVITLRHIRWLRLPREIRLIGSMDALRPGRSVERVRWAWFPNRLPAVVVWL
jgi:hypothetical protein